MRNGTAPAGILCAVVSQPADNMVSMLAANPKATMNSVIADMGMANLATRGLPLRILMVGTLTGLQWGIYDAYKVRMRAGGCASRPLGTTVWFMCSSRHERRRRKSR